MGGGGGSSDFKDYSSSDFRDKYRALNSEQDVINYESEVANIIDKSLSVFNNRDVEATRKHLDTIITALNNDPDYGGQVKVSLAGSVSKKTYIDGLSDIDALIIINKSELVDKSPKEVLNYFYDVITNRHKFTDVEEGDRSITVKYSDAEIQLVPAIKLANGIKIADEGGKEWSSIINPQAFAEKLTQRNQDLNGKVIPTIKVVKSIIFKLPEKKQLSGYHIEALAIKVFKDYPGEIQVKDMVKYFFSKASDYIEKPIKDSTGQSIHIDDKLGPANSIRRQVISDTLNRINRDIRTADDSLQGDFWKDLLSI